MKIPWEALALFKGRRIRIFPHLDESGIGERGALRWELELEAAGAAHVECFDLSDLQTMEGKPVKDLNDLFKVDDETLHSAGSLAVF